MIRHIPRETWLQVFLKNPDATNNEIALMMNVTPQGVRKARSRIFIKNQRTCATPGCDALLGSENKSGVCREHKHNVYCRCRLCGPEAPTDNVIRRKCIECDTPISANSNSTRCRACASRISGIANKERSDFWLATRASTAKGKWHANGTKLAAALGWPAPRNDPEARLLIAVAAGERDDVLAHKPHVAMRQAARRRLGRVQQSGAQPARSP